MARYSSLLRSSAMVRRSQTPFPTGPPPSGSWTRPAIGSSWEWQINGNSVIDETIPAQVYDIDAFGNTAADVARIRNRHQCYMIAYLDAGTSEDFRPDYSSFPSTIMGNSNGWPGEKWLDIRAISILQPIMEARADMAKAKGFDGIEWDNVDGYANTGADATGFPLTGAQQITYNKMLATITHARGMGVFLKNDTDQAAALQPFFDGLVVEEAFFYNEADSYMAFSSAGKPTFSAEYPLQHGSTSKLMSAALKADANTRNWSVCNFPYELDSGRWDANKTSDGPCALVSVSP